jgi:hypothetical protein
MIKFKVLRDNRFRHWRISIIVNFNIKFKGINARAGIQKLTVAALTL